MDKAARIRKQIIKRCSGKWKQGYDACSVHIDFSTVDGVRQWLKTQPSYEEDWHLDKDILEYGNKVYGPSTCVLIPGEVNQFFAREYSTGVYYHKPTWRIDCSIEGKIVKISGFSSEEEAVREYIRIKSEAAQRLADKWRGLIDDRVVSVLENYAERKKKILNIL